MLMLSSVWSLESPLSSVRRAIKELIRLILEKMMVYYYDSLAYIPHWPIQWCLSSVNEEILKAVETTKHWATDLMYGVRASIYEVLEAVKAWILKLRTKEVDTDAVKQDETEAVKEEEADEYDAEDEESEDEGPATKKIKLE